MSSEATEPKGETTVWLVKLDPLYLSGDSTLRTVSWRRIGKAFAFRDRAAAVASLRWVRANFSLPGDGPKLVRTTLERARARAEAEKKADRRRGR